MNYHNNAGCKILKDLRSLGPTNGRFKKGILFETKM